MLKINILTWKSHTNIKNKVFFRLNRELEKCQDKLLSKDQFPESGGYMRVQGIYKVMSITLHNIIKYLLF